MPMTGLIWAFEQIRKNVGHRNMAPWSVNASACMQGLGSLYQVLDFAQAIEQRKSRACR
jgi:hypothetical protein